MQQEASHPGVSDAPLDCLIVGAGPAGLAAAIYLARFRRRFVVVDSGASRARHIPLSRNYPGFAEGVAGADLLSRMSQQTRAYGPSIISGIIDKVERRTEDTFYATSEGQQFFARTVLLATGVVDEEPLLPNLRSAVADGLVRYCAVCDGFEVIDRRVAVVGYGATGLAEALFLRTYTPDVTLLTLRQPMKLTPEERGQVQEAGINVIEDPVRELTIVDNAIGALTLNGAAMHTFDALYSALGSSPRSELARQLGAFEDAKNCIVVDQHQRTSVDGVYAAGDVVQGLDQIAVAIGHAAVAACAIHTRLNKRD